MFDSQRGKLIYVPPPKGGLDILYLVPILLAFGIDDGMTLSCVQDISWT